MLQGSDGLGRNCTSAHGQSAAHDKPAHCGQRCVLDRLDGGQPELPAEYGHGFMPQEFGFGLELGLDFEQGMENAD